MHVKTAFCIIINAPFFMVLGYWDGEDYFLLPLKVYFLVVWRLRTVHNITFFGGWEMKLFMVMIFIAAKTWKLSKFQTPENNYNELWDISTM